MTVVPQPARRDLAALRSQPVDEVRARIRDGARLGKGPGPSELEFAAMGTRCRVSFHGGPGPEAVAAAVIDWVGAFEARYSRFLPASWVSQVNAAAGGDWLPMDAEAEGLMRLCGQLAYLTHGALDATALPLVQLWDWKAARVPSNAEVEAARGMVGWKNVEMASGKVRLAKPGMAIDLGGVGKEYAVDQVILLLARLGVASALVDFGADIRVLGRPWDGRPAWKIGLEDPQKPGTAWTHLVIRDGAVATSGSYIRGFESGGRRYGHIVDPRTGRPSDNDVLAASVMAPSCTQAGMLSTAACVLGAEAGRRLLLATPGVEGCLVTGKGVVGTARFHEHVTT
jgi:thiamine biosynthesis lipoprotein